MISEMCACQLAGWTLGFQRIILVSKKSEIRSEVIGRLNKKA